MATIRRMRRSPYVATESKRTPHSLLEIQVDAEVGRDLNLRWSNDGAQTWNNGRTFTIGDATARDGGQKAKFRRLGSPIARVYEITAIDGTDDLVAPPSEDSGCPDPTSPAAVSTTMPDTTGYTTIVVGNGGDLQAAINTASAGSGGYVITANAGSTYTGPFTFPARNVLDGTKWIIVKSSSGSIPAVGTTAVVADAANMPTITATTTGTPITFVSGSGYTRLIGLNVISANSSTAATCFDGIAIGDATDTAPGTMPKFVTVDRCLVRAHATGNLRRGVRLDGISLAVINSHIIAHEVGADSQGVLGFNGPGPFLIHKNHIEAAGENIMFGGALGGDTDNIPSDITITSNRITKSLTWWTAHGSYAGIHWLVKNHIELKNARRVLIDSNIMEYCWIDGQSGYSMVFTPRSSQSGTSAVVNDVKVQYNIIRHCASGVTVSGRDLDNSDTALRSSRVLFKHNLFYDIDNEHFGNNGDRARPLLLSNGAQGVQFVHNTIICDDPHSVMYVVPSGYTFGCFNYSSNIVASGSYGILVDGVGVGNSSLSPWAPSYTWLTNLVVGLIAGLDFPSVGTNTLNVLDFVSVKFENLGANDYRLASGSPFNDAASDGTDIGANVTQINTNTSGVPA